MNLPRASYRVFGASLAALLLFVVLLPVDVSGEEMIGIPFTIYGMDGGRPFLTPRGLFCDLQVDEILVADAGGHRIQIFDSEGWPKYEFIHWVERNGERIQGEPGAVAATPDGNIFIIDILSLDISIVNFRGLPLRNISAAELLPDQNEPALGVCLALGPEGHIFAICKANNDHFMVEMTNTGEVIGRVLMGQAGDLKQVTGIAVDAQRVYLSDLAAESCVQVFDRQGQRQLAFGIHDTGWGNFSFPAAISVTSLGHIWVVDQIRQIVNSFDAEGKFLGYIGGKGIGPGSMSYPCAVARDRRDRILVLEKVGRRCQAFVLPEGGGAASNSGT